MRLYRREKGFFSRFQLELTEKFTIFAVITNKIQTMEIPTPSIADLAELTGSPHLDGDLLLFDKLTDFPLPVGAGRTSNIVVALCLEGNSTYMANTVEHRVGPDDVLIIHDGQVVDGYRIDPAQRSIGLIMSPDFFHEVLKDIHELASLIIFSRSHPVFRLTPHETENMIEYYRLVTAMFMHFGIGHLVNNMLVLFVMGEPLEQALGHFRYLILYFVSGIGANWISMMRKGADSMVISAGASGAIFGVIGGLLSLAALNKGRLGNLSTRQLMIMVLFSLYFGFTSTGVDNTAHVSGLILGAILGILLHKRSKGYQTWEV